MGLLDRLKPTTPRPTDLIAAAAHDYLEADKLHQEGMTKLATVRSQIPALAECMRVMKSAVAAARQDLIEKTDARLKVFADPDFDEKYLGEVDISVDARNGALSATAFALFADAWLDLAEERLRKMGADKSRISFQQKRAEVATLEAEVSAVAQVRDTALNTWRKLTNTRTGYPE